MAVDELGEVVSCDVELALEFAHLLAELPLCGGGCGGVVEEERGADLDGGVGHGFAWTATWRPAQWYEQSDLHRKRYYCTALSDSALVLSAVAVRRHANAT